MDRHPSSTNNILHRSSTAVEKIGVLPQIEKAPEASGGDPTCRILHDPTCRITSGILTIEK